MLTEYRDSLGKLLTEEQLHKHNRYSELLIDPITNLVKISKHFADGAIFHVSYYLEAGEEEDLLVDELKNKYRRFSTILRLAVHPTYTIELTNDYSLYVDGPPLRLRSKSLFTNRRNLICNQVLDVETKLPIEKEMVKYYYRIDQDGNEHEILESCYTAGGLLDRIRFMPDENDQDWEHYDQTSFPKLQSYFSEDISYYLTASMEPVTIDLANL